MQLSNDLAALVGFACEAVLWGVNATLFLIALVILKRQHSHGNLVCNLSTYLTLFIFLCCTAHFALEFNHFYTTLNAIGVHNYANETTQLAGADYLISVTDFLGDLVLIYRCWLLWDEDYYVVGLPFLTAVGGLTSITGVLILLYTINPTSPTPPSVLVPLSLAGYILPLCTNVMVTSLIVFRIWASSRIASDSPLPFRGATRLAVMLVIESGALYLVFQLIFVLLVATQNSAEAIVAVMAVQIYGIAPTLIIIRVGLGISSEQISKSVASMPSQWNVHRVEESNVSETDGPEIVTDYEGARNLASSPDIGKLGDEEKAVQFVDPPEHSVNPLVM